MYSTVFTTLLIAVAHSASSPNESGNCLTQRIDFRDASRIYNLNGLPFPNGYISEVDPSRYDATIDYGAPGQTFVSSSGLTMQITKNPAGGDPIGTRVSTTRMMKYGKVTASFRASAVPGVVTTFITLGPQMPDPRIPKTGIDIDPHSGDEIDWEILGKDKNQAVTNVFYRGIKEFSKHDATIPVPSGVDQMNTYSIDWKKDEIVFELNGRVVRRYNRNGPEANSAFVPGIRYFPDRPQKVQMGLWSQSANTWTGGAAQFPPGTNSSTAQFDFIEVTCYDDNMRPVPKWPLDSPDRKQALPSQPVVATNAVQKDVGPISYGTFQAAPLPRSYTGPKPTVPAAIAAPPKPAAVPSPSSFNGTKSNNAASNLGPFAPPPAGKSSGDSATASIIMIALSLLPVLV